MTTKHDCTAYRGAMANWSEGYLHGLVSAQHSDALKERLAAEPLADIVKDMLQITRAGVDDDAWTMNPMKRRIQEIVEYLRVATQLIYEELAELRPADNAHEARRICSAQAVNLMRMVGDGRHRHPAVGAGAHAQSRSRVSLPPGQRFLLPDRFRRA